MVIRALEVVKFRLKNLANVMAPQRKLCASLYLKQPCTINMRN